MALTNTDKKEIERIVLVEFIQSVWAIGWPVRFVMVLMPVCVTALALGHRDMRRTEGDLHKKD